jgi:18S rRNA (adenine1779-N6/adenine1780-N6)-dimethyltransferase
VIDTIIEKAQIKPTDIILEIGGGTGNLTVKLLQKAKRVICYEKDTRLAAELVKRVNSIPGYSSKFQLIVGDALKCDFPYFFDMCISNTPYKISSPLIFKLVDYRFKCAYLMFQREFAERLVARPGNSEYSRLSVAIQITSQVDHVLKVSRNSFKPPPKVDSSVIRIEPKYPRPPINLEEFNKLLKVCFLRKNKTLHAVFKADSIGNMINKNGNCTSGKELKGVIKDVLNRSKLTDSRAAKMCIEDFLLLLLEFKRENINFK